MQTAVVLKPVSQFAEPAFVQTTETLDRMAAVMELIASRAYDIFENRGRQHGDDLADWLRAEEELFHTAHVHLHESNDALSLNAEVAGFSCEDLEVSVEPHRVSITGRRASNGITSRKVIYSDACADRIFRALPLPVEIDPEEGDRLPQGRNSSGGTAQGKSDAYRRNKNVFDCSGRGRPALD